MIGICLNNPAFEQDIRELLMAYYPGETFVHDERTEVSFCVKGQQEESRFVLQLLEGEQLERLCFEGETALVPDNRSESKSAIKRLLYQALCERNKGRKLPWGTLTGIRPTKIAMSRLEQGQSEEEIAAFMREQYLSSEEKIRLSIEIAKREKELLSVLDYETGYSLYVGIPFCPTTCLYCSFPSYPIGKWAKKTEQYLAALFKEMEFTAERMKGRKLDTIYMGGGTPTSLSPEDLDAIFTKLEELFDVSQAIEFTVEAGRPDSITREKLEVLRSHHISRISINPQTMKQETLDLIGRRHTVEQVKDCFYMAREMGFDNINMDLIVGLPEEDLEDVRATMEQIRLLNPDSVTVHSLAIKRAARLNLFREKYEGQIHGSQEMIDLTAEYAREMGLEPYYLYRQKNMAGNFENVGYAKAGKACLYNILIMEELQTIVACGAGTTTKVVFPKENRRERCENVKEVEQYIGRIDEMLQRKEKLLVKPS
ncbi:MAG: coproporphyrinogen dehydrogenase HemZ [bacterium]|nr:coproporphyrinogen dehydrogenase HemZ [bacterium]